MNSLSPKQLLSRWVETFNRGDADALAAMYHEDAVNHQVANDPVLGRAAICEMFRREFSAADMVCIVEHMFEDGDWAIMEWKDPMGFRGCGFFHFKDGLISFQRGYWDKLTFHKLYNIPLR
jgi:ketosteroid isomerase-like protein